MSNILETLGALPPPQFVIYKTYLLGQLQTGFDTHYIPIQKKENQPQDEGQVEPMGHQLQARQLIHQRDQRHMVIDIRCLS